MLLFLPRMIALNLMDGLFQNAPITSTQMCPLSSAMLGVRYQKYILWRGLKATLLVTIFLFFITKFASQLCICLIQKFESHDREIFVFIV
jgi:hypothetical protein